MVGVVQSVVWVLLRGCGMNERASEKLTRAGLGRLLAWMDTEGA
jgi:hypothetical protein